jgi:hypothetical protein
LVELCTSSITVTSNADSDAGTLRQAIADVCVGGTINFNNNYTITLTTSTLTIDKGMTIDGTGHSVVISGDKNGNAGADPGDVRVFNVNSGVTANLNNLTIATGYAANGAGISNAGTLNVTNCTFSNNKADDALGGGIYNSGALNVTNSTFSNNRADADDGGAIFNNGTLTVTNSTFSGNSASLGGGIFNAATTTLKNVIIASSTGGNCSNSGTLNDGGGNLEDDSTCGFSAPTSQNNTDPLLGTLGSYGGGTQTFPLLAGSPAIDAGDDATCAAAPVSGKDQRGQARDDLQCDMGAFELKYADSDWVQRPMSSMVMITFGPTLVGIQRDAGFTNPGVITVTKSTSWDNQGPESIDAWWKITPMVTSGISVTLKLCYTDAESNSLTLGNLRVWRYHAGAWSQVGVVPITSRDSFGNNCAQVPGVDAFSTWTLATGQPTVVRVTRLGAAPAVRVGWAWVLGLSGVLGIAALVVLGRRRRPS